MYFNAYIALVLVSKSKGFETGFGAIEFLKNRIFGFMGQNGLSRSPCVGTAFREFEHVWMTDMFIVELWLC